MRRFVQFYTLRKDPLHNDSFFYAELLGSDSIMFLDGRWSTATCHRKVKLHAERLSKVRSDVHGYRLARGSLIEPFFLNASVIPLNSAR